MKLTALLLLFVCVLLFASEALIDECNSYEREKLNEGYYNCVYNDPVGIPTIGVGCNLNKYSARAELRSVGANYDAVLAGSQCLNDSQIEWLFNMDMDTAVGWAKHWLSNWSQLGSRPQSAVADLAFNVGGSTLHGFVRLKRALEAKNYSGAIEEMKNSTWCSQVGERCVRDVKCMR